MTKFLLILALLAGLAACASRETVTKNPITVEFWEGPPCRVHVTELGAKEPAAIVRNPKGSALKCTVRGGE